MRQVFFNHVIVARLVVEQPGDVRINSVFLMGKVCPHLVHVGIKELLDGLTGTRRQHVGNPCQVPLDVWQPAVQVIVVRAHQVRDKVAHGRAFYHCLRWRIVVVAIHLRDKQEKLGSHTMLTAHLRYGFVAKPQWNAKVRQCEQQLRLRCHQCRQVVGCRINKFTHDISIVINASNYTQVSLTGNESSTKTGSLIVLGKDNEKSL